MKFVDVRGGKVAYDLVGRDDAPLLVLTPGGRAGMDRPGVRELGQALADGGLRVLLWDRPNCGHSDVQFHGRTESHLRADTLAALLSQLELGPALLAGGSDGARDSLLTALLHPEVVGGLALWNFTGGVYGLMVAASVDVLPQIPVVQRLGMEGVAKLPDWQEQIELNPTNRARFLAFDPHDFEHVMLTWLDAFVPRPGQTVPGVEDGEFSRLTVPTLIVRGGENDQEHTRRMSLELSTLIPNSTLVEPPWPEDAWERANERAARGEGSLFGYWYQAAPLILDFARTLPETGSVA
jgi:pimeloyl-ACP methyl ester carboxylesterase